MSCFSKRAAMHRPIWRSVPGSRSQLFVELMSAAGVNSDDDLGRLIRQIEACGIFMEVGLH